MNIHEIVRFHPTESPRGPRKRDLPTGDFLNDSLESFRRKLLVEGNPAYIMRSERLEIVIIEAILENGSDQYYASYSMTSAGHESCTDTTLIRLYAEELNYSVLKQSLDAQSLVIVPKNKQFWEELKVLSSGVEFQAPTSRDTQIRDRFLTDLNRARINEAATNSLLEERSATPERYKNFFLSRAEFALNEFAITKGKVIVRS